MNLFMDNDEKENNPMRFVDLEDKSLYNNDYASYRASSEFLDCSMPLVVDSYNVCSGNCFYCFAYVFKETNSMVDFNNLKIKSINVNKYKDIFEKKINIGSRDKLIYNLFFNKKKIIQWGSLADPFCNFERRYHIGEELVKIFIEQNYPVRFCSKFKIPDSILKLLQDNPHRNFVFMYSIVTADNKVSASVEDATHTPDARFKQLKELSEMGYYTILRLRPFIVGITDRTLDTILLKIKENKINAISVEFYSMDLRCSSKVYERNNKEFSKYIGMDYYQFYKSISKTTNRGTYLRLNRDLKEFYIRKIYDFCINNNIHLAVSDPDFKELNMSGSCCGLPDYNQNNKWDKVISNYSRLQATEMLTRMRREFWKINTVDDVLNNNIKDVEFTFDDFMNLDSTMSDFWNDKSNSGNFLSVHERRLSMGKRRSSNLKLFVLENFWNELKDSNCLVNYFDYKIIPLRKDNNGFIIYKYNVMPYEILWQTKYGYDLKKF